MRKLSATVLSLACTTLLAGPPYLTDDPEPVDLHRFEAFLFATGQDSQGRRAGLGPALEVNYGPFQNAQFQLQVPLAFNGDVDGSRHRGYGDTQLGFKYRFREETEGLPQLALYPQIQAPTGGAAAGLGAGHWRVFLPFWLQKSFGQWTTYGGGGWWRNPGAGNRDYTQFGWLLQRQLGPDCTIGAEIFRQGAPTLGARPTTCWNLGCELPLVHHLQLVGSAGRVIQGGSGSQFYLGIRGRT